ncbi:tetratricopeptide repeat protein [Moorena producens JHB]|uniref:Tetratricopeptide repeat protein n=1 Tax=Moorena producens (strain JHB) TaxID=1454205 RepID=A0A1D9G9R8_MOOP1|nr:tetratricopeptide repeat protein [Moorena producens]AOY84367.1 tetratricopeptide repeat protein [Moorena producens JHB]
MIKSQPHNPHAYFMLGNAQGQQDDIDAAIANYRKAMEKRSHHLCKSRSTLSPSPDLRTPPTLLSYSATRKAAMLRAEGRS